VKLVKKLVILFKLLLLTVLKKNHAKAEVIRKSNIFKEYGRGGVLASMLDSYPSGSN
jgi:hypothetical protein